MNSVINSRQRVPLTDLNKSELSEYREKLDKTYEAINSDGDYATLKSSGALISLSCNQYQNMYSHIPLGEEVARGKNAKTKRGVHVRVNLLAENDHKLKAIAKHVSQSRAKSIYPYAFPWTSGQGGMMYVPTGNIPTVMQKTSSDENFFWKLVDEFCLAYPSLKAKMPDILEDLYDESKYQHVDVVRASFTWNLNWGDVDATSHFFLELEQDKLNDMHDKKLKAISKAVEDNSRSMYKKVHDHVATLIHKATTTVDDEGNETKPRIHDTLIPKMQEDCEVLKHLNVMNDPTLEAMRADLLKLVTGTDVEALRDSVAEREEVKAKAEAMREKFNF